MSENEQPTANLVLSGLKLPKEPQIFQFKIIGEIEKQVYERLLGYRITIVKKKDPNTGIVFDVPKKDRAFEPILTDWGGNRIITMAYIFINEQAPFGHITSNTVIKMTNLFLKQLNADMYKNFERYFIEDQRTITTWRMVLATIGFMVLMVLSRAIEGRESLLYYEGQRAVFSGNINPQQAR